MSLTQKWDVLDMLISVLLEHERRLSEIVERLEVALEIVGDKA